MTEQQEVKPEIQEVVPELEQHQEEKEMETPEPVQQELMYFNTEDYKKLTTDLQEVAEFDEKTQKYVLKVAKLRYEMKFTPNVPQSQRDAQTELILIDEMNDEIMILMKALSSPSCVLSPEEKKQKMHEYVAMNYVILENLIEKEKRYRLNPVQLNELKNNKKKIEKIAPLEGLDIQEAAKNARIKINQEIFEKVQNCTKEEEEMKLKENMENGILQKEEKKSE